MINVKLNPTMFDPGNYFYGTPPSKAVLHIGGDRNDLFLAKNPGVHGSGEDGYRGNQYQLLIDLTGTQFENLMFEMLMQNPISSNSYGKQLIDLVIKNMITIDQDGVILTPTQILNYTAP